MNRTVSFCIKNQQGRVSLIRILKIQPSGACYIDYEKKTTIIICPYILRINIIAMVKCI